MIRNQDLKGHALLVSNYTDFNNPECKEYILKAFAADAEEIEKLKEIERLKKTQDRYVAELEKQLDVCRSILKLKADPVCEPENNMTLKIKLDEGAIMPTRAHAVDAGLDIYAPYDIRIPPTQCDCIFAAKVGSVTIDTGVHIEIPEGYVGMLKSKSGLNVNYNLINEGVIDAGYTGSIKVKMYNMGMHPVVINKGEKLTQLVIMPIITPELKHVDKFEDTERGNGGFGSTGKCK